MQWIRPAIGNKTRLADVSQDTPYLSPIIAEIEAEIKEREDLEAMVVKKPAKRS